MSCKELQTQLYMNHRVTPVHVLRYLTLNIFLMPRHVYLPLAFTCAITRDVTCVRFVRHTSTEMWVGSRADFQHIEQVMCSSSSRPFHELFACYSDLSKKHTIIFCTIRVPLYSWLTKMSASGRVVPGDTAGSYPRFRSIK